MKKWFGLGLIISLTASMASAVWPFGAGSQKSVTNETPSASVPSPRSAPRIFSEQKVAQSEAATRLGSRPESQARATKRKIKMEEMINHREETKRLMDSARKEPVSSKKMELGDQIRSRLNEEADMVLEINRDRLEQLKDERQTSLQSYKGGEEFLQMNQTEIEKAEQSRQKIMNQDASGNEQGRSSDKALKDAQEREQGLKEKRTMAEQMLQRQRESLNKMDQEIAKLSGVIASNSVERTEEKGGTH